MRPILSIRLILILLTFAGFAVLDAAEATKPAWLVGNGFHSSLAVRAGDFHGSRQLTGDVHPDILVIGWGGADYYRGKKDLRTILRSTLWPTRSALHVIPVRGAITRRFPHSDVICFNLSAERHRLLVSELDAAFARDVHGQRIFLGSGYLPQSRFYAGRERFCLFKMCNAWSAQKLQLSGASILVAPAIIPAFLTAQAAHLGHREQKRSRPSDSF